LGAPGESARAQCGSRLTPEHAGLFTARADDGFASGLDARTDEKPLIAKSTLLHPILAKTIGAVDEQHDLQGQSQAPADGFLAQLRIELINGSEGGDVSLALTNVPALKGCTKRSSHNCASRSQGSNCCWFPTSRDFAMKLPSRSRLAGTSTIS